MPARERAPEDVGKRGGAGDAAAAAADDHRQLALVVHLPYHRNQSDLSGSDLIITTPAIFIRVVVVKRTLERIIGMLHGLISQRIVRQRRDGVHRKGPADRAVRSRACSETPCGYTRLSEGPITLPGAFVKMIGAAAAAGAVMAGMALSISLTWSK